MWLFEYPAWIKFVLLTVMVCAAIAFVYSLFAIRKRPCFNVTICTGLLLIIMGTVVFCKTDWSAPVYAVFLFLRVFLPFILYVIFEAVFNRFVASPKYRMIFYIGLSLLFIAVAVGFGIAWIPSPSYQKIEPVHIYLCLHFSAILFVCLVARIVERAKHPWIAVAIFSLGSCMLSFLGTYFLREDERRCVEEEIEHLRYLQQSSPTNQTPNP